MKKNNRWLSAVDKKLNEILIKGEIKYIGTCADTLKAKINLMPNFSVVIA